MSEFLFKGTIKPNKQNLLKLQVLSEQQSDDPSPITSPEIPTPPPNAGPFTSNPGPSTSNLGPSTSNTGPSTSNPGPSSTSNALKRPHAALDDYLDVVRPVTVNKSRKLDEQLLRMIVKEYRPFSIVESKEFVKLVHMLMPGYQLPSRKTISNGLLTAVYNDKMESCKKQLDAVNHVSLTTDGWTSINNESFAAIAARFIDADHEMRSMLLECSEFPASHTAQNLADGLLSACNTWGLSGKVAAVTTDNAANTVSAIEMTRFRHIPCFAHCLNLIVKSSIAAREIQAVVGKVKRVVKFFKKSSAAVTKLRDFQKQMNLPEHKLMQDVETRWNSTFDMLRRFNENKNPILATLAVVESSPDVSFHKDDWEIVDGLINYLTIFHSITVEVSTEKMVSISLLRFLYKFFKQHVEKCLLNCTLNQPLATMGKALLDNLVSRFDKLCQGQIIM
ncbi:hypothetical protein JTE90_024744 [Oedothorax gibbosus]|uniref:Zinc finger BED domain-containing protein 1-like n=1 Tax=Oedothorax gibbosus TaxID=931172 RepID=A0AAV6UAG7_9ARAC|nr:hypothetical protein JTE90_024744 [Oedothorax gibbosus]